jgi:hypothetical protein
MRQHGLLAAAPKDGVRGRPVLGGYRRAAGSRGHIDASLGARARRSRTISSNWAQHARRMTMSMRSGLNPGMGVEAKSREGDTGDRRGSAQPAGPLPTRTYDATHRRRTPWARDMYVGRDVRRAHAKEAGLAAHLISASGTAPTVVSPALGSRPGSTLRRELGFEWTISAQEQCLGLSDWPRGAWPHGSLHQCTDRTYFDLGISDRCARFPVGESLRQKPPKQSR